MQLTGKQIIERGIISNYCEVGIQQQGVDVRVKNIFSFEPFLSVPWDGPISNHNQGIIYKNKKAEIRKTILLEPTIIEGREMYHLIKGYVYEVELEEGCVIPNNAALVFKTRSSLVRCGARVDSGQFDAGFETTNMGCFIFPFDDIYIERGARIAQAVVYESAVVENLYNGTYQNDKQRESASPTVMEETTNNTQWPSTEVTEIATTTEEVLPEKQSKKKSK